MSFITRKFNLRLMQGLLVIALFGAIACSERQQQSAVHNSTAGANGDKARDSGDKPVVASSASGGQIYQRNCSSCHGAKAEGNPGMQAPALAGQARDYLQRQLRNFADGLRGSDPADRQGRLMVAFATGLDSVARSELANYLNTLPATQTTAVALDPSSDRFKKGRNNYQSYCASCHGFNAGGNAQLQAPKLAGLDAAYLTRQYQNFAQGLRGQHADDQYGRQMRAIATSFSDPAMLDDVIAYIGLIK